MGSFNPHSTVRAPYWENIYDTLERLGWDKRGSNSRYTFYHKKNWRAWIPHTTQVEIMYFRVKGGK